MLDHMARGALVAMREPTKAMLEAVRPCLQTSPREDEAGIDAWTSQVLNAAIDAAFREQP